MNIQFTFDDMRSALERIGYECKLEKETEEICYVGGSEFKEFYVWNLYYKGNKVMDTGWENLGGSNRLERVFKNEVHKRILLLF
jgi:hypothetical protein